MNKNSNARSYAVIGLGEFGISVATELMKSDFEVLVVDNNEEKVQEIADSVTMAVQADVCDRKAMQGLGLSNMDGVIVCMSGSLEASIMAILFAKECNVPFVLAKSKNRIQTAIFEKIGADRVITPEHDAGIRAARSVIEGNFVDFFELSDRIKMIEIRMKPEWIGKSLASLDLRKKYRLNVVAIRQNGELTVNVDPSMPLDEKSTMLVTIDKKDLDRLR